MVVKGAPMRGATTDEAAVPLVMQDTRILFRRCAYACFNQLLRPSILHITRKNWKWDGITRITSLTNKRKIRCEGWNMVNIGREKGGVTVEPTPAKGIVVHQQSYDNNRRTYRSKRQKVWRRDGKLLNPKHIQKMTLSSWIKNTFRRWH